MSNTARIEANLKTMPVGSKVSRQTVLGYDVGKVVRHTKTRIIVQWHATSPETPYSADTCKEVGYRGSYPDWIMPYKPWHDAHNKREKCEREIREEKDKLKPNRFSAATVRETAQRLIELCDTHDQLTAEIEAGREGVYSPWGS